MRPAVITAVLLLVGIINTVTALSKQEVDSACRVKHIEICEDINWAWSSYDGGRCIKYFKPPKTFQEAQDHCHSLDTELVSIHDEEEMIHVMCLSLFISYDPVPFWIGAKRSGDGFKNTDGTEFKYTNWFPDEPNNHEGLEDCVESNYEDWGKWNDSRCSVKKPFVCMKKE